MKLRLAEPAHLIDITRIEGLSGVVDDGDQVSVGALTTHHELSRDKLIRSAVPIIAETADVIGDRQVRNRGTIGGALAHADAAADYPAPLLALEAQLVARGPEGKRAIAADDFFVDFLTTALAPEEVLTEIRLPKSPPRTGSSYQKLANHASGYAVVGVAAIVTLGSDGTATDVRIGVTGTAPVAFRAREAEAALTGKGPDAAAIRAAAELVGNGVEPLSDLHASGEYRLTVTRGLARRAMEAAVERAGGAA
jgi:carbon-monoxide dehydrogenase medium subunit